MKIDAFLKFYGKPKYSINKLSVEWKSQKQADDFLGTEIFTGVTVLDYAMGNGLRESVPPNISSALKQIYPTAASTPESAREQIIKLVKSGEASTEGWLNGVQGRLGEFRLQELLGEKAQIPSNPTQEGWDIFLENSDGGHHIQVKVYSRASEVIEKIKEVEEKISNSDILGVDGVPLDRIDFAVNDDILEEVKSLAEKNGLNTRIIGIGASRKELRDIAEKGKNLLADYDGFLGEFLEAAGSAACFHFAFNAFLVIQGSKSRAMAIEDTIYSSGISAGGILAAMSADLLVDETLAYVASEIILAKSVCGILGGPLGFATSVGVGQSSRAILKRVGQRRFFVRRLVEGNSALAMAVEAAFSPIRKDLSLSK